MRILTMLSAVAALIAAGLGVPSEAAPTDLVPTIVEVRGRPARTWAQLEGVARQHGKGDVPARESWWCDG